MSRSLSTPEKSTAWGLMMLRSTLRLSAPTRIGGMARPPRSGELRDRSLQRVDRNMQLEALLAFRPVIGRPFAAFGRGAQGPTVDDRRARLDWATRRQPQQGRRSYTSLKASRRKPALGLLIHRCPRRQIIRHPTPWRPRFHDVCSGSPLNTSRRVCSRCPASSRCSVRYGATSDHSSSDTSDGYGGAGAINDLAPFDQHIAALGHHILL